MPMSVLDSIKVLGVICGQPRVLPPFPASEVQLKLSIHHPLDYFPNELVGLGQRAEDESARGEWCVASDDESGCEIER